MKTYNYTNKEIKKDVISFAILMVGIFLLMKLFFIQDETMSPSMEPTLMTGEFVYYEKVSHHLTGVENGDIINFEAYNSHLAKRVIGIGGDRITFENGYVYRNGEKLDEPYVMEAGTTFEGLESSYIVPEGYVFVLGDNRECSNDSRNWDNPYVSLDDILGTYFFTRPY